MSVSTEAILATQTIRTNIPIVGQMISTEQAVQMAKIIDSYMKDTPLKAAAPELLEALEWLVNRGEWAEHHVAVDMELSKAKAAIAKAKGNE